MVLSRKFYNTYFGRRNEVIRDYAATLKPNISLAIGNTPLMQVVADYCWG